MAKSTFTTNCRICPYCGHEYEPEPATYSEYERKEDCMECGKVYLSYDSHSVVHYAVSIDADPAAEEHEEEGKRRAWVERGKVREL